MDENCYWRFIKGWLTTLLWKNKLQCWMFIHILQSKGTRKTEGCCTAAQ